MIRTLVVDDDYRVADIHAAYVGRVEGFAVTGQAHSAAAAYTAIQEQPTDLVLLDLYLPDEHGLALTRRIQALPRRPDVMVISAARDIHSLRTAMQLGAVHYLVKPFTFDLLRDRLAAYRKLRERIARLDQASQEDVDDLYALMRQPAMLRLPKGQSEPTMSRILDALRASPDDVSAAELADAVGISRPTAQRYLAQLVRAGLVDLDLRYGTAGRPLHQYRAHR